MPKRDRSEPHSDVEDVAVHLKPILGIRPGAYLTVLYGIIIVLSLFFLLFYPGLKNRGAYVSLTTFPEHATVKVDGIYAGSTPCTIFVKRGNRTLEITKPFYTPVSLRENIRGRVFATLFVRDRKNQTQRLLPADVSGLLKWALADFQKNPRIPQIISDTSQAAWGANSKPDLYNFINNCMLFITDESQLRELILGLSRIASSGAAMSPIAFVDLVRQAIHLKQKYDNFPSWLQTVLSSSNRGKISSSAWVQTYLSSYKDSISAYYQPATFAPGGGPGNSLNVMGITFRAIPQGDVVMGKDDSLDSQGKSVDLIFAHPVRIDLFYIGVTEVTNRQYQAFLNENPDWAPGNNAALVKKGLVSASYLAEWPGGKIPAGRDAYPVTSVSWNAAVAFTSWLSQKVQQVLPGYQARLPSEAEWEWAARGGLRGLPYPLGGKPGGAVFFQKGIAGPSAAGTSEPNGYGLRDMLGNVWEWCADPFSLTANLLTSLDPRVNASLERALPDAPDRAVRGGSWTSQPGTVKVYTRGSQPADWSTPYLGFRVALSRR